MENLLNARHTAYFWRCRGELKERAVFASLELPIYMEKEIRLIFIRDGKF